MSAYRTPKVLVVTNSSTTVPKQLSSTPLPCTRAIVVGRKAARTANTGTVWLGPSSTDTTQPIDIPSQSSYGLEQVDLSDWYLDVETANDGVVIIYW